jgi:deoxyadenosine/deoxycytidine kinase
VTDGLTSLFTSAGTSPAHVWSPPAPQVGEESPVYVCVIGQSGSGKSTLVRSLSRELASRGSSVIGIDERSTHHPFLDRLFYAPERYGLELQLNFMLQRVLVARRWLDAGVSIVMERSHLDDIIFARHLRSQGLISEPEFETYLELWKALLRRAPRPRLVIALSVSAEAALSRLARSEELGERPKELWIREWSGLYAERIAELTQDPVDMDQFVVIDETTSPEQVYDRVEGLL